MPVQYAKYSYRQAPMTSEFAQKMMERYFGAAATAAILEAFPKYVRGPKKDTLKGSIHWTKCTEGGWHRTENGHGRVMYPGTSNWFVTIGFDREGPSIEAALRHSNHFTDENMWLSFVREHAHHISNLPKDVLGRKYG